MKIRQYSFSEDTTVSRPLTDEAEKILEERKKAIERAKNKKTIQRKDQSNDSIEEEKTGP